MPHTKYIDTKVYPLKVHENDIVKRHKNPIIGFCHERHIEMWNWLAANPTNNKKDWPEWDLLKHKSILNNTPKDPIPVNYCYACEYVIQNFGFLTKRYYPFGYCQVTCPLVWPNEYNCFDSGSNGKDLQPGLFRQYELAKKAGDFTLASTLATQIAELPLRENIQTVNPEIYKRRCRYGCFCEENNIPIITS